MKKMLKFTIVITIIFALLSGNVAVIAANTTNVNTKQATKTTAQEENKAANNSKTETSQKELPDKENKTTEDKSNEDSAKKEDEKEKSKENTTSSKKTTISNSNENEIMTIQEDQTNEEDETKTETGRLNLIIDLKLPNEGIDSSYFETTLVKTNPKEGEDAKTYTGVGYGTGKEGKLYYEFKDLPTDEVVGDNEGKTDYNLTVKVNEKKAKRVYQTYSYTIPVKPKMATTLEIVNSFDVKALENGANRAIMGVGDIITSSGDVVGNINDNDINKMIEAIEAGDKSYDLNGDGKINIIDLSYIAYNKGNQGTQSGKTGYDQIIIADENTFADQAKSETTTVTGDLNNILENNNKYVSLAPKEGTEISEEKPVELTIDLGKENETKTEEITISPSPNPENNIQSGVVTVVYTEDGSEEEKTMELDIGKAGEIIADAINGERLLGEYAEITSDTTKGKAGTTIESDGTIVINLGGQIAVKKITIKVTSTKSKKLADIAKVEFLNGMEDRIPAPTIQAPSGLFGTASAESLVISWDAMPNVTGYEVEIKDEDGQVEYHLTEANQISLQQFKTKDFKDLHYKNFDVRVQSINGEWKSGFGETKTLTPTPNGPPPAPDNLFVKGGIKEIKATWKKMNSTLSYNVQYRRADETEDDWKVAATETTANECTITGLEDKVKYLVRVQGVNDYNTKSVGPFCTPGEATTTMVEPATLPRYGAINLPTKDGNGNEQEGVLTEHVLDATYSHRADGLGPVTYMVDSELDGETTNLTNNTRPAQGVVDNTFTSHYYVRDWDDGGHYVATDATKGLTITFDNEQDINYITTAQIENLGNIVNANVIYWGEDGVKKGPVKASQVVTRRDANGRDYTAIKLPETIKAKKINVQIGRYSWDTRKITVAEIRFHDIGDLEQRVNDLFTDQMHLELKDEVNEQKVADLQKELDTTDQDEYRPAIDEDGNVEPHNGEFNPEKESIQKELTLAKDLLSAKKAEVIKIDSNLTKKKDGHITFSGGLNAWQPLGTVAYSGEKIKVYVGNPNKKIGDSTDLRLIATQYHAEAAYWKSGDIPLKVGINEITVPEIITSAREKGGSLYVEYVGNNASDDYAVRVSGGESIPVLDLTKLDKTDANYQTNRTKAITDYVSALEEQVKNLKTNHDENHKKIEAFKDYEYDEENCIAGATEVVLDQMMYSVSAKGLLSGLDGEGDKVEKLDNSLKAMDEMIDLFYAHKGLSKESADKVGATNVYPSSRLNIRYHIMFAGAAMYAGGLHIGIPYGDVATLSRGNPIQKEADGKYISGNYFGWGISHEIGHIINEGYYVHGEVTNNYFSVLSQAKDTNDSVRFKYPEVYKKVMSGKTGKAQNVFTQLGLYWQFHLANDTTKYNFDNSYESYDEQFNSLVFARMDTYAREYKKNGKTTAPKAEEKGIELKLDTSVEPYVKTDNNLMRLACAATKHNVLTFFEKWGMEPDNETIAYANQFEKIYEEGTDKEKAIWYINDDARAYQIAGGAKMTQGAQVQAEVKDVEGHKNQKAISLNVTGNNNPDAILGYEINRISWDHGNEVVTPVGFITAEELKATNGEYVDTIETINNRVFEYRITAYDKYLNSTEQVKTVQFKVQNDGYQGNKAEWEITTNYVTEEEAKLAKDKTDTLHGAKSDCSASEEETEGNDVSPAVRTLIDNGKTDNGNTVDYKAKAPSNEGGEIIISLPEQAVLTGFKYTTASKKELKDYTVEVSKDGKEWEKALEEHTGMVSSIMNISLDNNGTHTAYFNPDGTDELRVFEAKYVKLTIKDTDIAISEIDLIGKTGDNIDFIEEDGHYGIGILDEDVVLERGTDETPTSIIPAGSIVFTGTYKGNPAYNTPVVYKEDGWPMDAYGAVFAPELSNEKDKLGEVSSGTWIYWLEENDEVTKEMFNKVKNGEITKVRAELYRTDDAKTSEGERLTSDTYLVDIPRQEDGTFYNIHIDSGK